MPERLKRDLEELSAWELWLIHLHCHRILIRDRLRLWWRVPRPITFSLVACYCMFALLLVLPHEAASILKAFGGGVSFAAVMDFGLTTFMGAEHGM